MFETFKIAEYLREWHIVPNGDIWECDSVSSILKKSQFREYKDVLIVQGNVNKFSKFTPRSVW